jgi:hypothetical protein
MAVTTTSAGTGPITQTTKTPGDILMEQLLTSVTGPAVNSLLDISATSSKTGTDTKNSSTSTSAQASIDQQIAALEASLATGNTQYQDLINNIMTNAAQEFNPTQARSRQSGAYNSTTLEMLSNDAKAKATAKSAEVVLADKKAKQLALIDLIKANATTNATDKVTYDTETEAQANRIGGGAGTTAAIGGAALLAQQLLGTSAGKDLTSTGIKALKKIFDLSGNSTGLPANWFEDLSGAVGTESIDDILAALGTQEASQQAMEDAMLNVFGSGDAASSWLTNSGVTTDLLSSGAASASGFAALANAADGKWGWSDTGSTIGSAIGTTIGGPVGGAIGSTLGSIGGEYIGNDVESGNAFLNMSTLGLGEVWNEAGDIVGGALEGIGDVGSDIWEGAFGWVDDGCFITTAVMKAQLNEFSDNCRELTMLRRVRDEYIAHLPNGPEMLAAYREFAPVYVERISKRPDAETVWKLLYDEYILEAVKHAEAGHFRKAYLVYLLMLENVQQSSFGGV